MLVHPVAPWLFLALSVFACAVSWNTLYPLRRPWPATALGFAFGFIAGEIPVQRLAVDLAVIALCAWWGVLLTPAGLAGLALMSLSWIALFLNLRLALKAGDICTNALAAVPGTPPRPLPTWQLLLPIAWAPGVEEIRDVVFSREDGVELKLDVYRPRVRAGACPTLINVHGGAWISGFKRNQAQPMLRQLASLGWVCFNVDYRLSPKATFPEHLIDVKRALRWVKEHGAELGADPSFIVIAGNSAGGHLASLAALTPDDKRYQPGFENLDLSVRGCISIYGVYDFLDRRGPRPRDWTRGLLRQLVMKTSPSRDLDAWNRASPIQCITPGAPPFLMVHGDRDVLVPIDQARRFSAALRAVASAPVYYVELPGAQHAFDLFPSIRTAAFVQAATRFANDLWARKLEERRGQVASLAG